MRAFGFLGLAICLTAPQSAFCSGDGRGFSVLDGWYHVGGNAWGVLPMEGGVVEQSYDLVDDWQARSLSGSAWIGPWNRSASSADWLKLSVGSSAGTMPYYDTATSFASAEGWWEFQPKYATARLALEGYLYADSGIAVELRDLTAGGTVLLSEEWGHSSPRPYYNPLTGGQPYSVDVLVDPSHFYYFHACLDSSAENDGPWDANLQLLIIPAPDAVVLGTIGTGLITWLRRRRRL